MAPTNASAEPEPHATTPLSTVARNGLLALVAVNAVNLLAMEAGLAVWEVPPEFVGGSFGPLAMLPVVVNSTIAVAGATLVYAVLVRYAARPNRAFVRVAAVALVLSFAMFLAPDLAGAPIAVFAILAVMHVLAAGLIVGIFTRAAGKEDVSR